MAMRLRDIQEEVLACLGRVGIAARQAVESMLSGQHRSIHRGLSVDFVGHRPYEAGDDIRHLDWQVYARTDRYAVRVYQEETRLRATMVVDCSASMGYGEGSLQKLAYARNLAAALGVLMIWQGDSVSLATGDRRLRSQLSPGSTMGHLSRMLRDLEEAQALGGTDLSRLLGQVARRARRRGLVVFLTDGGDDPQRLLQGLHLLRHRRQDVLLYLISHPDEDELTAGGMVEFQDLESGEVVAIDADRARAAYLEQRRLFQRAIAAGCRDIGVQLEILRSDEDLHTVLARSLGPRRSLAGKDP